MSTKIRFTGIHSFTMSHLRGASVMMRNACSPLSSTTANRNCGAGDDDHGHDQLRNTGYGAEGSTAISRQGTQLLSQPEGRGLAASEGKQTSGHQALRGIRDGGGHAHFKTEWRLGGSWPIECSPYEPFTVFMSMERRTNTHAPCATYITFLQKLIQ
eukprot:1159001-Pelagomonas_calceolata.AAC.6